MYKYVYVNMCITWETTAGLKRVGRGPGAERRVQPRGPRGDSPARDPRPPPATTARLESFVGQSFRTNHTNRPHSGGGGALLREGGLISYQSRPSASFPRRDPRAPPAATVRLRGPQKELFIDNLLVRIHYIVVMIR